MDCAFWGRCAGIGIMWILTLMSKSPRALQQAAGFSLPTSECLVGNFRCGKHQAAQEFRRNRRVTMVSLSAS